MTLPPACHAAPLDLRRGLASDPGAVRAALQSLQADLADRGVPGPLAEAAQIILAEVLNNVVEHAYRFEEGHPIGLTLRAGEDGLWCEVTDEGMAMPGHRPPPDRLPRIDGAMRNDLPEGGFGWSLVHRMTRDLTYRRVGGRNHLAFLIPPPAPEG